MVAPTVYVRNLVVLCNNLNFTFSFKDPFATLRMTKEVRTIKIILSF